MSPYMFPLTFIILLFLLNDIAVISSTSVAIADSAVYGDKEILRLNKLQWKHQMISNNHPTLLSLKTSKSLL